MQVMEGDVNEALRLMNMSKISLEDDDTQEHVQHDPVRDAFSKVCFNFSVTLPARECFFGLSQADHCHEHRKNGAALDL